MPNSSAKAHNKTMIQQWIISSTESVFYFDVFDWLIDTSVGVCCDWLQGELLSPCRCAGSVRHAHQQCLLKWISEKGSWSCELCNYRFNILPIHIKPPQQVNTRILGFMIYPSGLQTKKMTPKMKHLETFLNRTFLIQTKIPIHTKNDKDNYNNNYVNVHSSKL